MARNKYDVDETLEAPFSFSHLKRAGKYIKKHAGAMIASLIFCAIASIMSLCGPKIIQFALDTTIPGKDVKQLVWLSVLMLVTIVISVVLNTLRSRVMTRVGQTIIYDIRKDLFAHMQKLSFQYYDDRPHGKILVRVVNYVNNVSDMLSNGLINMVLEIINIVFITVFMFLTSPKLSLIILAGVPVFLAVVLIIKPIQRRCWQQVSNKNSNMNAYLHESLEGAKINQIFTREEVNRGIFGTQNQNCRRTWMKAQKTSNLVWASVDTISILVVAALYLVGVLWFTPAISFGVIYAMAMYAGRFWQPILNLANIYNNFINSIAYLERIFETMDEPVTVDDAPNAKDLPAVEGRVTFDDVTFSYDGTKNILEHLSFDVKPGESIALVGPTGAGKTTIVNLISRFYNLDGGQVLIDGQDIAEVTLHSLRSQMGIMLQDSFIFSGTIADNIRYGRLDATDAEVRRACETVQASEFIEQMPKGYATEVNERGSRLSQGQKQLVAFARTLLSDPKILILDEATSSIDAKTEELLQRGLLELLKGRTSFIIAHRLSTIMHCDKIMYVDNRGITECGTHDELLRKGGDYYKLFTAQMAEN